MHTVPLYYNPLINMVLDKLENHDNCAFSIYEETWRVWYPLDGFVEDISSLNEVLAEYDFQLATVAVKANGSFKEDEIDEETVECIKQSIGILRKRLDPNCPPRIPEYAIILEDDAHDWLHIYEALFIGQLMTTGQEKWKTYTAYRGQFPTHEELKKLKVVVFPGSGRAVYDFNVAWVPQLINLVQRIYSDYPKIKMIGGCFGAQLIA